MVTNLYENKNGKTIQKCEQYWPNLEETIVFEQKGFQISNVGEVAEEDLVERKFEIKFEGKSTTKQITQYHF